MGALTNANGQPVGAGNPLHVHSVGASTPTEATVTMTNADTEYHIDLPDGTRKFTVTLREGDADFRVSFSAGKVATSVEPYQGFSAGQSYSEDGLSTDGVTMYFACSTAGKTIQVISWQ